MQKTNLIICIGLLCLLFFSTTSCNENAQSAATQATTPTVKAIDIPPLLDRNDALAKLPEWKNIQTTVADLHKKLAKNPADYKSGLYLAALYMQEARISGEHPYYYPASLKILDHIIATQPKDNNVLFEALTSKASVQLSQHEFDKALSIGKQALALETHSAKVYGILCDASLELGDYDMAVKMADKMVSIRPDLRSYSRVSYLREIHGDYKGAVEAMELAIAAGLPGAEATAWCQVTLGDLHFNNGEVEKALAQYETALNERPNFAFALAGKAAIAEQKGDFDKAIQLLNEAIEVMPEFSFFESLAHIYQAQGATQKVNELTQELLTMLKEDQESGHNMNLELSGIYLDLANNTEKAFEYAMSEYQKRPQNIETNHAVAKVYFEKGEYDNVVNYTDNALKTNIQDADLFCLAGLAQYKTGKKEEGLALMKKAFDINAQLNSDIAMSAKKLLTQS